MQKLSVDRGHRATNRTITLKLLKSYPLVHGFTVLKNEINSIIVELFLQANIFIWRKSDFLSRF